MQALLTTLTVLEIALVLGVLLTYLVLIRESLRRTAKLLAKVAFGVRAIEKQVTPVPAHVLRINGSLERLSTALPGLSDAARRRPG